MMLSATSLESHAGRLPNIFVGVEEVGVVRSSLCFCMVDNNLAWISVFC